jgi:hypothetical protein
LRNTTLFNNIPNFWNNVRKQVRDFFPLSFSWIFLDSLTVRASLNLSFSVSQSEVQSIPDIQSTLPINDSGVDVLDYSKQDILQETKDHLEGTVRTSASIQESAISMASPERNKNTIESVASISNIPSTKTEILEDNTNNISHIQGEVTEVMSHSEQEQQYLGKPEEPLKSEQEQEQTDEQEDEAIRYELNQQAIKDSIQQEVGPVSDEVCLY